MNFVLTVLATAFLTWLITYETLYSPKAQIRGLWKGVFRLANKVAEQRKRFPDVPDPLADAYEQIIQKKKLMINNLLDYHFDLEEDEEYLTENRP